MAEAFKADYERKYHDRLANDFPFYSRWCLKIRTKPGSLESFIFNKAQEYLHQKVEEQRQATGRVRVLILKGRQQGMSTYIGGRFYWLTTHNKGKSTFSNLPDVFGYVKYFTIKNNDYNEFFLSEYFYSKKEERNLKLKQKLTKLNNFNRWKRMIL